MDPFDVLPIELLDCILQDFTPNDKISLVCTRFYTRLHNTRKLLSYFIDHFDFDERDLEGVNFFELFRKIRRNKGPLIDVLFEVNPLLWASYTNIHSLDGKLSLVQAKKLYYTIVEGKLNEYQIRTIFRAYRHDFGNRHDRNITERLFLAFGRPHSGRSFSLEKDFVAAMTCNNFELFFKYLEFREFVPRMLNYNYKMTKDEYYYCKNIAPTEKLYRFLEPDVLAEIFDEEGLTLSQKVDLAFRNRLLFRVKDEEKFTLMLYLQRLASDNKYHHDKLAKFNDIEY